MDDLARGVQAIIDAAEERGKRMALEVAAYERSIVLKQELIEALSAEVERWKGFAARAARQMDDMAGDTGNESPDLSDEIQAALGAKP
jgi:phage I-like protein